MRVRSRIWRTRKSGGRVPGSLGLRSVRSGRLQGDYSGVFLRYVDFLLEHVRRFGHDM